MIPTDILNRAIRYAQRTRQWVFVLPDPEEPENHGIADEWTARTHYAGREKLATISPDGEVVA
jgi:hypothetical protein